VNLIFRIREKRIMSKARFLILAVLLIILSASSAYAQDGSTPTPFPSLTPEPAPTLEPLTPASPMPLVYMMTVTTTATDEKTLVGDLYLLDTARPTVLLLHQLYTDRHSWEPDVIPALLTAGYNALAVDVRGHGQTGGFVDWDKAIQDTQVWIDWLRANNLGAVVLMGSSMGSSLALVGCGNDPQCLGAIAISPGWNYYEVNVKQTFAALLGARPVLIVYADHDYWPSVGVPLMLEVATGDVQVVTYPGNAHGMDLFRSEEALLLTIKEWLVMHVG
jgi:pimeloyl-ACP methyl ester carboxylesterase